MNSPILMKVCCDVIQPENRWLCYPAWLFLCSSLVLCSLKYQLELFFCIRREMELISCHLCCLYDLSACSEMSLSTFTEVLLLNTKCELLFILCNFILLHRWYVKSYLVNLSGCWLIVINIRSTHKNYPEIRFTIIYTKQVSLDVRV